MITISKFSIPYYLSRVKPFEEESCSRHYRALPFYCEISEAEAATCTCMNVEA